MSIFSFHPKQNFYENIKASDVRSDHLARDVFGRLLDDEITEAISSLPEDFRTVIILSDIEGFTYEEIADFVEPFRKLWDDRFNKLESIMKDFKTNK